jgi:asparagine synthase (glutamine-hydrolysing)
MCGICGSSDDPTGTAVAAMARLLEHRGPDDESFHVDPQSGVALGCRRLSIIDVEGGRQPLSNEDGSVWAVLNGEIYNHPQLQERLAQKGHRLATRSDTEVLVHLYEDYGDDLVHALEGMFAFAVWDARRGRLLVGRDRYGEKPLFYSQRGGRLVFASELHALLAGSPGLGELNPAAVDAYFIHGYVPGPGSIVEGVHQLPPAHTLSWEAGRPLQLRPYWQAPRSAASCTEPLPELVAELERLLEASMRSRLIADVPLGVLLSGGVDSSLIATLAAAQARGPVKAFTVGYDVGSVTEVDEARATARAIGAEHHVFTLTEEDVREQVPDVLGRLDQPLADQALVPLHAVSRFAREHVKVAVGGEGADELFGGYPRYRWLWRASQWGAVVPERAARGAASVLAALSTNGRGRRIAHIISPQSTLRRHLDWVTDRRAAVRADVYGPRLLPLAHADPGIADLAMMLESETRHQPRVEDMMLLDQRHWLPHDVLAKADRASMLASLEIRTPYLHREVAEFAASVPARVHTQGRGKALLRALLENVAPRANHRRSKVAFRAPTAEWLRGCLGPVLDDQLERGTIFEDGWFSRHEVIRLRRQHEAGNDQSAVLWPVLAFGIWLDRFGRNGSR